MNPFKRIITTKLKGFANAHGTRTSAPLKAIPRLMRALLDAQ